MEDAYEVVGKTGSSSRLVKKTRTLRLSYKRARMTARKRFIRYISMKKASALSQMAHVIKEVSKMGFPMGRA